ncbi:MAG: phospho-N-acetylmuramoyl-pentapeptide-transferase [Myxococcota bacterium]|nr:phospho-N-acetylmuramoyl-pentapeptide-transferase [Myxococcota bacterium]
MIYYLLYPLTDDFRFLNVLRYVPFRVLAATLTAMFLTFGLYPWFIRALQKKQVGQVVRKEGPQSHWSKAGTPTMGGSLMLLALVLSTVLWADPKNPMVWVVTAITASYGVVGYIDDAAKVRKKSTGGLAGRYKLLFQFAVAGALCAWLFYAEEGLPPDWIAIRDRLHVPFVKFLSNERLAELGQEPLVLPKWLYVIFASFVIVGTSNAVNLTDGLDGLAIGPVMINAGTYAILAYLGGAVLFKVSVAEYLYIPYLDSSSELAIYCASVIGVGFGFLWFNTYPATVFMGDVGSLALGGGIGALAVVTKNELTSLLLGGIFVVEALSVMIQVGVFKATKGKKRVFLMAPIHHHFEKKGWPEPKVIVRFWIVSIMLAVATLATLKLR